MPEYCYKHPHPAVTTDCVVFGRDGDSLKVLLIERGNEPFKGKWAFPGGFMNIDETAEECARRELFEETGLDCPCLTQFHAFTDVGRDPRERVISIAYYAFTDISEVRGGDDAAKARWFPLDRLPELAFDHAKILNMALEHIGQMKVCQNFHFGTTP